MRDVLLALSLVSNGRTAAYDSSGGGDADYMLVDDNGRAKLGPGDAPHLTYERLWNDAGSDERRRVVLDRAIAELAAIRKSSADPNAVEPKDERDRRIIKDGEGFPAHVVAIAVRCGVTDVWRAREARGRDHEFGERRANGCQLSVADRNTEILRLTDKGLSQRECADRMGLERGSVRYVLARNKPPAAA